MQSCLLDFHEFADQHRFGLLQIDPDTMTPADIRQLLRTHGAQTRVMQEFCTKFRGLIEQWIEALNAS
jgi:hypothetical protein